MACRKSAVIRISPCFFTAKDFVFGSAAKSIIASENLPEEISIQKSLLVWLAPP